MNIDDVKLGQRVVFAREGGPKEKSRLTLGMKGVVVASVRRNHHLEYDMAVVLWEGFNKGWKYEPTYAAECLKEQPTYPGAPKFGEYNGWYCKVEDLQPIVEEEKPPRFCKFGERTFEGYYHAPEDKC